MKKIGFLIIVLLLGWGSASAAPLRVFGLTCEYTENPLGIDVPKPVLGWKMASDERGQWQSAYEILVSESESGLAQEKQLLWRSGKIRGSQNVCIAYNGKPLKPFARYYWKVRVYDRDGVVSEWSPVAWWETAMLSDRDWTAQWIGDGSKPPAAEADFYKDQPAPVFRKSFEARKPIARARLYVAGLGYYEASLNGERVGDRVLDPGWTNYGKDILYSTYDVTPMLTDGGNRIEVMLGNGFYNPLPMRVFQPLREYLTIGQPCLTAQLRIIYTDGTAETVVTDTSWETAPGPVMRNNVYLGEHYDARQVPTGWKPAVPATPPTGRLTAQLQPPIRVTKILRPVRMTECRPGVYIFDLGQNMAGVLGLRVKGPAGTKVSMRYGEDVHPDGSLNGMTSVAGQQKRVWDADWSAPGQPPIAWQEDSYTLKGTGETETWAPRFTFHGFRYVEVTGWPGRPTLDNIEALRMNADLARTGTFECSDPMLNRLHEVLDNTFLSNVFSVQSDCPAREKFGYGGDIVGVARTFCWFYDMENLYRKAIRDFANDQRPLGGMTETAPYNGIADRGLGDESGPIGWQLGFAFMQKQLYEFYGDRRTIEAYYPQLKRQVEFLRAQATDGLTVEQCINDHESLEERFPALFATAHYYHHVRLLAEFGALTGRTQEAGEYTRLAQDIKAAFIARFVTSGDGTIGNATQSAQAVALWYDLLPDTEKPAAFARLLEAIERWDGHMASGIFGVPLILDVLRQNDRNDIAYRMVTQKTFPGWGYMLERGATTLWETWAYSDNTFSQNHPMFGSVGEWMYQSLAGINATAPGFAEFTVKPQPAGNLQWVKSSFESINGPIVSRWEKADSHFTLQVEVPVNTHAVIYVPSGERSVITESGQPVEQAKGLTRAGYQNGYTWFEAGSGTYDFRVTE